MDFAAHALYGATFCSRSGVAGGKRGAGVPWPRDWTVWAGLGFGVLPDVVSMGAPFFAWLASGGGEHIGYFFRDFDGTGLVIYRYMHSLIVAGCLALLCYLLYRPLFIPALAWPLHILTDAYTHGLGKFRTTVFYPVTDWAFDGWPWWMSRNLILAYWLVLPLTWLFVHIIRGSQGQAAKAENSPVD